MSTTESSQSRGDAETLRELDCIGTQIVEAALDVHRELGPGLLETVYEIVFSCELEARGLSVQRQVQVPIVYKGIVFDQGFRADMIVEKKIVVELKSIEQINPVHKKQVLTYLRLTGTKLGYLLNFGGALMKSGIFRIVNGLPGDAPLSAPPRLCVSGNGGVL